MKVHVHIAMNIITWPCSLLYIAFNEVCPHNHIHDSSFGSNATPQSVSAVKGSGAVTIIGV